jgi:hypothetical protein
MLFKMYQQYLLGLWMLQLHPQCHWSNLLHLDDKKICNLLFCCYEHLNQTKLSTMVARFNGQISYTLILYCIFPRTFQKFCPPILPM